MELHRAGETGHYPFRSDRMYHANNAWYFLIRGGASKGPFANAEEANQALEDYIQTQIKLNKVFQHASQEERH